MSVSLFKIFHCDRSHRVSGVCAILVRDIFAASLINLPLDLFENLQVTDTEIMIGCHIMVIYSKYNPPGCVSANIAKLCDIIIYLCIKNT